MKLMDMREWPPRPAAAPAANEQASRRATLGEARVNQSGGQPGWGPRMVVALGLCGDWAKAGGGGGRGVGWVLG